MRRRYRFPQLSRDERELLEQVLLEEMDLQRWYAVRSCAVLDGEVLIPLQ